MGGLLQVCAIAFGLAMGVVIVLALRRRVLLKLGLRHAPRQPGRTALIIGGLMLGTLIISAAFSTGDTMTNTVRSSTLKALGNIDEIVSVQTSNTQNTPFTDTQKQVDYIDQSVFPRVEEAARSTGLVDGVAPVIMDLVAVQDSTTRQNEPRVTLFATDPAKMEGLGSIRAHGGGPVSLADLAPGEVYLNDFARKELKASPGDELLVFASGRPNLLRVRAIVDYDGGGGTESGMLMSLPAAQELLGRQGLIRYIVISNQGGPLSGVGKTDQVIDALKPVLTPLALEAQPTKQDALDFAEQLGNAFLSVFTAFGAFSIIAGFMLIFLIFVTLAAERKTEMGISRAIGTQRRQLVEMFLFEGVLYDLVAAAVGAALGVAVAYGMVFVLARAFANFGIDIKHELRLQSLAIAYMLGMLLTFAVVVVSAWRVSVLNIVTAIRDLPDPVRPRRSRRTLFLGIAALGIGLLMILGGINSLNATLFHMGISLCVVSLVPLLRRLGFADRVAYTIPAIILLTWWLLPFNTLDFILPHFKSDISLFIFAGVILVLASSWLVMYNSDLLLRALSALLGRTKALAPAVKTAVSYPLTNRFRTGMTLAMFTLIVFTLVVMATVNHAFVQAYNDIDAFSGGFDVRATTVRANPIRDMPAAVRNSNSLNPDDFTAIASESVSFLEVRQAGDPQFHDYPLLGPDDSFLANTTYGFTILARGYNSDREVWEAMARDPTLAVVDTLAVPRREDFQVGAARQEFKLKGFYLEDDSFDPVPIEVRNPATGNVARFTVIAVLKPNPGPLMEGVTISNRGVLAAFGPDAATPVVYLFRLRQGVNAKATAQALESAFLDNGMEAKSLREELDKFVGTQLTFNWILQGFMGLGLVVGVTALGVISARAVVERRQQIGVLRAIGFQRWMVQTVFLMESSFIALTSIVVGLALGLIISRNVIASESSTTEGISFVVPWLNLGLIFGITYVVAMAATFIPARQASRVLPAEALRYE